MIRRMMRRLLFLDRLGNNSSSNSNSGRSSGRNSGNGRSWSNAGRNFRWVLLNSYGELREIWEKYVYFLGV